MRSETSQPDADLQPRYLALDGVRGIAIFAVLLYHHHWMNSGWFGVDLFFVLSGYLITTILRNSRFKTSYYSDFWMKRATRILPPLILCLVAAVLFDSLSTKWAAICLITGGDYAAVHLAGSKEAIVPLWSLAVEEHFYFLWPFVIPYLRRRVLVSLLLLLLVGEPLLRFSYAVLAHPRWEVIYFLTPFRLDGLALGGLLALACESKRMVILVGRASIPGVCITLASYAALRLGLGKSFSRDGNSAAYNALIYSLIPILAFSAIAYLLAHKHSAIAAMLSWKPIVYVGQISYGLYLYHPLTLALLMRWTGWNHRQVFPINALASGMLAASSFHFVEAPLIGWGRRKANSFRTR